MDSLTQLALGAAVGEAVLGKKVGNKALVWGAVAGTVPDLDVVFSLFMDPVNYLSVHRGFSHSLFFPFIAAPLLAFVAHRVHRRTEQASRFDWTKLFFWGIITHPLLDLMTGYGTQLFYPLTRHGYELNTIFVIDPAYTLPLLVGIIAAAFYKREAPRRRYWNWAGIGIATAYLLLTVPLKLTAIPHFERALEAQEIDYERMRTFPNPFTSFYWRALAETPDGNYVEAHYSHFWRDYEIRFTRIPGQHALLEESSVKRSYAGGELLWFSKGYYAVRETDDDRLLFHDLRFGALEGWRGIYEDFTFSFLVYPHAPRNAAEEQERASAYVPGFEQMGLDADITSDDIRAYFRSVFVQPPLQDGHETASGPERSP